MIHQNRKLLSFILTAAVFWGTLFACILPVRAQSAGQVKITSIDSTAFPTMNVQFEAYDAQGQFVQTLTAATLSLYENDLEQPVQSLELRNPGVQFTLAVNGGPELVRLYAGQPRFDAIFQNLGDWVMHQPAKTNDLFSLAASNSLALIRSGDPQQWASAINSLAEIDFQQATPGLEEITAAVDLATDPSTQSNMKRAILWITPLFTPENIASLQNLGDRAAQQGVTLNIWVTASQSNADAAPDVYAALQSMAAATGGQVTLFSGAESLPDIETYLNPLRYFYQASYQSAANTSGAVEIVLQASGADLEARSPVKAADLTISAPSPIFIAPRTTIERAWAVPAGGSAETLTPASIQYSIVIEFPDGHQRPLAASRLYVDDLLVSENTAEPFDTFTWDLSAITETSQHTLRAEVEDGLGLTQSTIHIPVTVNVQAQQHSLIKSLLSGDRPLIFGAILAGALMLAAVLYWSGRGWRRLAAQRQAAAPQDSLTRPISTPRRESAAQNVKTLPSVERPTWPRSATAGLSSAPAWLVRLPDLDDSGSAGSAQRASASAIPLTRREVTLGSSSQRANFSIQSTSVSELHARIVQTPEGGFQIFDAGSVAGTWVNYAPVPSTGLLLRHGDIIHLGRATFRFELANPPDELRLPREV